MVSNVKIGLNTSGLFNAKSISGNENTRARFNRDDGTVKPHKNENSPALSQARRNSNAFKKFQEDANGDLKFVPSAHASAKALQNAGPKHHKNKGSEIDPPETPETTEIPVPQSPPETTKPKVIFNPADHVTPKKEDKANITAHGALIQRVGKVRVLNIHHVDFDKDNLTAGEKVSLKLSDTLKVANNKNYAAYTQTNTERRLEEARENAKSTETSITRAKRAAQKHEDVFKSAVPKKLQAQFTEAPAPQTSGLDERSPEAKALNKLEGLGEDGLLV